MKQPKSILITKQTLPTKDKDRRFYRIEVDMGDSRHVWDTKKCDIEEVTDILMGRLVDFKLDKLQKANDELMAVIKEQENNRQRQPYYSRWF